MAQENVTRVPPQSIESEMAVLGAMMLDDSAASRGIELLQDDDFYRDSHQLIFHAMSKLYADSKPIDQLTVTEKLSQLKVLEKCGGTFYVSNLVEAMPTAANIDYYATIVKNKSILRHIISVSTKMITDAYNEEDEVENILDNAQQQIYKLKAQSAPSDFVQIGDIVHSTIDRIEMLRNHDQDVIGLHTGFVALDKMTSGFQPSDLIIIAGRPSMGKTAVSLSMMLRMAVKYKKKVGFFSLEMSNEQLVMRLLSMGSGIDHQKLRKGRVPGDMYNNLLNTASTIHESSIFVDDTPSLTIMDIRSRARRVKIEKGLDIVFVDYLQIARGLTSRSSTREQEISSISQGLKAMAKELHIPVVAVAQLNRAVDARSGDHRPHLSDLRESGAIEQDADVVMFIYREEVYSKDPEHENKAELIISKQRNGPIGRIHLTFLKHLTLFEDAPIGDYDPEEAF
ncbi:MAG TPA: replicative DNA helicase [Candidatus Marinimicrobia bacterium]|nr:replicative DNA helicase [Candidatus Neomarinimicrobiota bacterium]